MRNIITYTRENFDTFEVRPFCPVDSLILSAAAYIHFPKVFPEVTGFQGMTVQQLYRAEFFEEMFHGILTAEDTKKLFTAMAASPRFRSVKIMGYTEQFDSVAEKQFSAVTFQISPSLCYIAFRGTDSTFVGWKEDFNMAFKYPIPSQEEAVRYMENAALYCSGSIYTGGHSKGGNLAVYASAMCRENVRCRISRIFSHDGPGFTAETLKSARFQQILPLVEKTMPQSSIVGLLFENQKEYHIVKSNQIGGIMQHDPYTWTLEKEDFVYTEKITKDAKYADQTLNDWVRQISEEDRERFIDSLYGVLNANDLTTLESFRTNWHKNIPAAIHAASQLDSDTKRFLLRTIKELASLGIKNISTAFKNVP